MLLNKDLVPLPVKKDKVEVVEQLVFHYTKQFYAETIAVSTEGLESKVGQEEAELEEEDYDG